MKPEGPGMELCQSLPVGLEESAETVLIQGEILLLWATVQPCILSTNLESQQQIAAKMLKALSYSTVRPLSDVDYKHVLKANQLACQPLCYPNQPSGLLVACQDD